MAQSAFHGRLGGFDFLGRRQGRGGGTEIVYDDGVARRRIWKIRGEADPGALDDALARAVKATRVLPALYTELRKRSIVIDAVPS